MTWHTKHANYQFLASTAAIDLLSLYIQQQGTLNKGRLVSLASAVASGPKATPSYKHDVSYGQNSLYTA